MTTKTASDDKPNSVYNRPVVINICNGMTNIPVTHNISNDSINQLKNRSYDIIVDIGCGDGSLTKLLANQLAHNQLIGIDCVTDMISYARKHNSLMIDDKHDNNNRIIEYVVQDMSVDWPAMCPRIRQLESRVDLIFSNYALQYIPDKQKLMQIFDRLLATGAIN
ncbi:trans-aconitate 2-methyltransferase-like [Oppia nitens]|uniref:trans-aconitate 2-methyltransferase-like n=1 Tax=Oppia nitens TaxID=1686743 RepID=UPI0023DB9265|nr:trans-aconitate 2-methyltransferase-like [Oppia nitens]